MPLYSFKCSTCNAATERIVKSDVTYVECPNCSGKAEKQLSAPGGFDLKGDGWYKGNASKPPEA
jgi:putative FmdB family regulatory protein